MALPLFLAMMGGLGIAEHQMQKGRKAQAAKARQAGAQNIMAGAGFGGPQAGLDPVRVAGLQQGLASSDPMIRQQAFAEMQDYQAGLGMDLTPQQQQQMQRGEQLMAQTDQSMDIAAAQEQRAAAQFPGQMKGQELRNELTAMGIQQTAQQMAYAAENQAMEVAANQAAQEVIPLMPETVTVQNPLTGRVDNIAVAGEDYQKSQASVDAYMRNLSSISDMVAMIDEYGSEWGGDVGVRMSNTRTGILFGSVQARGGGAPQEAELELMAQGLPDPTAWQANVRGVAQGMVPFLGDKFRQAQEAKFIAGYDQLRLETSRAVKDMLLINPTLNVDIDALDPRIWVNDAEREYYKANSGQAILGY